MTHYIDHERVRAGLPPRFGAGGFEARFKVTRTDGKPCRPEARYIVLDYAGDPHAKKALAVYADSIEAENPVMAADIRDALVNPERHPAQHENAQWPALPPSLQR